MVQAATERERERERERGRGSERLGGGTRRSEGQREK